MNNNCRFVCSLVLFAIYAIVSGSSTPVGGNLGNRVGDQSSSSGSGSELRFDVEPVDTVAVRGQTAVLDCRASFQPQTRDGAGVSQRPPDVYWIKDGTRLKYDSRRYRASNGSLVFTTIEHSLTDRPDEGIYQCAAKLASHGTIVSRRANITIAYLNQTFSVQPVDVTVSGGDVAVFSCRIGGAPWPRVRWFKEDAEITNVIETADGQGGRGQGSRYVVYSVQGEGMLQISAVRSSDAGRYRCQADSGGVGLDQPSPRYSRFAQLSFNASLVAASGASRSGSVPVFVIRPRDVSIVEGGSVMLTCGANGRDRRGTTPDITWLKDSALLDTQTNERLLIKGQGTLIILNAEPSDTGAYICRATSIEDSVDAVAYLNVRARPRFRRKPNDVVARAHSDAVLECDVDDESTSVTIDWLKNGDPLVGSDYFLIDEGGRKLSILGLVPSDAGMYQCTATNGVGMTQAAARLVVVPKDFELAATRVSTSRPSNAGQLLRAVVGRRGPGIPDELMATMVLATSVRLTWRAPADNADSVTGYVVYWQEDSIQRERSVNTTSPAVTLNHLKPSTHYVFHVAACDREGAGSETAQVAVETTTEDAVPGVPTNLRALPLSPTSLRVTWDGPSPMAATTRSSLTDGTVESPTSTNAPTRTLYYRLYYYDVHDTASGENDLTVTEREIELRDLCKYCEYSLRVVAYSANGPSASSDEVTCRTLSDVPSGSPQNVTLEAVSTAMIVVSWEPPSEGTRNGQITGYKIRYKPRGERGAGDSVTTDGSRRSFELNSLERATEYSIRLQAMTVNGTGPATAWLTAETYAHNLDETSVPGKPTSLRVRPMTNSIVVSWTPPMEQDIMIRGYILGYGIGIPDVFRQVLDARQRYYTVKSLKSSSEYVVSLKAFNDAGEGEPIYETLFTREETTPEPVVPLMPPVGVDAVSSSSSSILVSWADTPSQTGSYGDGRIYTVRYGQRSMRGRYRYVNVTTASARIEDLRPDTEYELSVKVSRTTRHSTWSMSVFVRTREAAPSTSPRELTPTVVDRRPTFVTLSWQPPRQTNGQITGYIIYYTIDSTRRDSDWTLEAISGDRLSAIIRELRPDTTYYFKVAARNRAGISPMSPTVIFRTPRSDGTGGGMIETPDDQNHMLPGRNQWPFASTQSYLVKGDSQDGATGGLPPLVLWIVVGSIGGLFLVATAVIVTAVICCKRNSAARNRAAANGKADYMAKHGSLTRDVNPPDLWIHHGLVGSGDKGNDDDNVASVGRPSSRGNRSDRSSVRNYDLTTDDERYSTLQPMQPIMTSSVHEPLMKPVPSNLISVDSLGSHSSAMPQSPYQRSVYSGVPRVNVGDISMPSGKSLKGPGASTSFKSPPTAAAVIFTSRPPQSPRRCPPTSSYVQEMSKFPRLESCQLLDDIDGKELTSEIAGLEGLMKDLSAISQRQFDN